jgi:hypothetical protein
MNAKNTGHQGASDLGIEKLELNVVPYLKGEAAALPTVERLLRDSDCAASPQRQRKYTALVFSSPNQARAKLETVTGSLAHFEILNEDT